VHKETTHGGGNCDEGLEDTRNWLALTDGRVHVVEKISRITVSIRSKSLEDTQHVPGVKIRRLCGIHDAATTCKRESEC
jgi:hypothetical protein